MQFHDVCCEITYQPGEIPEFYYRSGLAVYKEQFKNGSLVAAGWNTAGYLPSRKNMGETDAFDYLTEPAAFHLELNGQCADYGFRLVDFQIEKQQHGQHGFCRAIIAQHQQFVCAGITCRGETGRAAGDVDGKIEKICQQYLRGESQRRCGQLLRQRHRRARFINVTRRQDDERGDGYQRHWNADGEPFGGERAALAAYKVERHKHAEDAEQVAADEPYQAAQGGGEDGF